MSIRFSQSGLSCQVRSFMSGPSSQIKSVKSGFSGYIRFVWLSQSLVKLGVFDEVRSIWSSQIYLVKLNLFSPVDLIK